MENKNPQDQPLEFLKREDVRTMAKDMAKLREGQAKVERARISQTPNSAQTKFEQPQAPQEVELRAEESAPERSSASAQGPEVPPLMPHQRRGLGKLFIRILLVAVILFVIFNALALAYWLSQKREPSPEPSPTPSPGPAVQPITTPDPVFAIASVEQLPLQKGGNLVSTLQDISTTTHTSGFTRIVLVLPQENRVWNAKEFFSGLSVPVPQEIESGLQEQLTLFLYANTQGKNRLGFAIPIVQGKDIGAALTAWEVNLERDLSLFFSFQGQKDSFAVSFFRESTYKGNRIRYQTFSSQDFGLVYAVIKNVLVVTSSFESMRAVIDEII